MPDLAFLDTLSNEELLEKWLERGLPNIPVNDLNRHGILRRLRLVYLGHTTAWITMNVVTDYSDNDAGAENTPDSPPFPRM